MKLNKIQLLSISFFLFVFTTAAPGQIASYLDISIKDDQGSSTYLMGFGNHVNATWGMLGEKDSLDPVHIEKESPPLPPGLGVVWRPSRSPSNMWGIGYLVYDIKGWMNEAQLDTFKLYFANAGATDADITFSWSDSITLREHCTALLLKIGGDTYDMFTQTSVTIPDAGDHGIATAYIYKNGAILYEYIDMGVKQEKAVIPEEFRLYQNYPNPFNPTTTITFDVLKSSKVDISVYNIIGEKVASIASHELVPGKYSTTWNGTNFSNEIVSSGVYFVHMIARNRGIEHYSAVHKLLFMK